MPLAYKPSSTPIGNRWFKGDGYPFSMEVNGYEIYPTADLSNADLSNADLSNANLPGANLRGANLTQANLTGAQLSFANLNGANLTGANLSYVDLDNLNGAQLINADLTEANLTGANLCFAILPGVQQSRCHGRVQQFNMVPPCVCFLQSCAWCTPNASALELGVDMEGRQAVMMGMSS
jgi:hypothetical protein